MRHLIVLVFLLVSLFALSQDKTNKNLPEIEFEEIVYDFGEIEYGADGDHDFVFKNVGKAPLIIKNAKAS